MFATATLTALLLAGSAQAGDSGAPNDPAEDPAFAETGFPVVVLGRLVCMPCLLDHSDGASDLCELMNHGHQLLVEVAQDRTGNDLGALRGEILDYTQPFDAEGIVLGEPWHGRKLLIHGAMEANHLRIDSVRPVREPPTERRGDAG